MSQWNLQQQQPRRSRQQQGPRCLLWVHPLMVEPGGGMYHCRSGPAVRCLALVVTALVQSSSILLASHQLLVAALCHLCASGRHCWRCCMASQVT